MDLTNVDQFEKLITGIAILIPVVTAIVGMVKATGYMSKEFTPFLAALIGAGLAIAIVDVTLIVALAGFVTGLSSVGLYEAGKQGSRKA
jgi:hypothetical protein